MNKIVDEMVLKVENLEFDLADDEISSIVAGLNDFLDSHDKVIVIITKIIESDNNEEIQDGLIALQVELVNHIKYHIIDMENPLMKIINKLG